MNAHLGADEILKAVVDAIAGMGKPLMVLGTNMNTTIGCVKGVKRESPFPEAKRGTYS